VDTSTAGDQRIAITVTGPIPAEQLGWTLPHEHLLILLRTFTEFDAGPLRELQRQPVTLENLGWVRQYWTWNADNMRLDDEALATAELTRFRAAGGSTLVDLTLPGVGRDPLALARMSQATGVNVIVGCGAYVAWLQPEAVKAATVEALAASWIAEAREGIDGTGIRPGIIGEIGCTWPIEPSEDRALRAAAITQRKTGLAISVHPGRNRGAPAQIVGILDDAGADLDRVVIGHLDRTIPTVDGLIELARSGAWLEFDCFGLETSYYPVPGISDIDMPSDAQRLDRVRGLIDAGFVSRILLSQDICSKHRLARYGGHGYDHLLGNVVPWMRQRGFTDGEVDQLFVGNPASILAVASRPASTHNG
jgi:phosphotriesterase-related protein